MVEITEQGPETAHNIKEVVLVPPKLQDRPPLQTTMSLRHADFPLQRRSEELAMLGAFYNDRPPHHLPTTMPNAASQRQVEHHESGASPAIGQRTKSPQDSSWGHAAGFPSPRTNGIALPSAGLERTTVPGRPSSSPWSNAVTSLAEDREERR